MVIARNGKHNTFTGFRSGIFIIRCEMCHHYFNSNCSYTARCYGCQTSNDTLKFYKGNGEWRCPYRYYQLQPNHVGYGRIDTR